MSRLLILGLDGGTLDLVVPWVEQGRMPTFARLLRDGASGPLRSVPNINTAPAWTSFMTGKNPGRHGIFWFAEEGEEAGRVRFVNAADRDGTTIWRHLSDAGRRVCVVNVPLTYPAEPVNGVMIAGFDAPSTTSSRFTHPEGLVAELERACGPYLLNAAVAGHASAGRRDKVVAEALRAEESRVRAVLHLMREQPWDVFMYMIKATDQAAHYLWDYEADSQEDLWPVYEYADAALARMLEVAGPDCGVLVMSDHGMGWRQPAAEYLNDVLAQLGYLTRKQSAGRSSTWKAFRVAKRLGPRAKGFVKSRFPGAYKRFGYQVRFGNIDWDNTSAYCDNTRSCVWINLRGRNPNGVVEADDYPRLMEEIKEVLLGLTDTATEEPVVEAVWSAEEIYSGPHTAEAPDLQIDWRYERPVSGLRYAGRLGDATATHSAKGTMNELTGAHRPLGMMVAAGPPFRRGRVADARLEDIAPTLLHLEGLPVPDDMDGRVLLELLTEPLASAPVRVGAAGGTGATAATEYSAEEAAEVEERLRALGYL